MRAMMKWAASLTLCLLVSDAGTLTAQQQIFACSKICWNPSTGAATCSTKLGTQLQLTAYIWAVEQDKIAKGKGITFSLNLQSKGETCESETAQRQLISVAGYVEVKRITDFTVGALKIGNVIEIDGTGVDEAQRNIMFYPAPMKKMSSCAIPTDRAISSRCTATASSVTSSSSRGGLGNLDRGISGISA